MNIHNQSIATKLAKINIDPNTKLHIFCFITAILYCALSIGFVVSSYTSATEKTGPLSQSFIIKGTNVEKVALEVERVGAYVSHQLPIINAVGAKLTQNQHKELLTHSAIENIYPASAVESNWLDNDSDSENENENENENSKATTIIADNSFVSRSKVDKLHERHLDGTGVTIAFIDTGVHHKLKNLVNNVDGENRMLVQYNAITNQIEENARKT